MLRKFSHLRVPILPVTLFKVKTNPHAVFWIKRSGMKTTKQTELSFRMGKPPFSLPLIDKITKSLQPIQNLTDNNNQ